MVKPGIYRHYKGKDYKVIGIARHSETAEELVVYEPLYKTDYKLSVRPLKMCLAEVEVDGKMVPRYKFLEG